MYTTVRELVTQGYTPEHAERYVAMLREQAVPQQRGQQPRTARDETASLSAAPPEGEARQPKRSARKQRKAAYEAQREAIALVLSGGMVTGEIPPVVVNRVDTNDIRAWAKAHNMPVKDRGRIPAAVFKAYSERPAGT